MIISPSVLSLHYDEMKKQTEELNASGAEWMHFDVMDGHFVPNLTFGPDILKGFCRISDLFKDVHLMVTDPVFFADIFIDAGADLITFHQEVLTDEEIHSLIRHIHERGRKAGISIKPGTGIDTLRPFLGEADLFLIMSVEPGFGGQKFIPSSAEKITDLKNMIRESGSSALIQVDGGINAETAKTACDAGADVLVAGSYVFRDDIGKAVRSLCGIQPSSR